MNLTSNKKWIDDFTLALRLREINGSAIGAALTEVQTHLADTGQDASEAFGDPKAYAASLDFPVSAQAEPLNLTTTMSSTVLFLAGWLLLVPALGAWLRGEAEFPIRWGTVAAGIVVVVATSAILFAADWLLARAWAFLGLFGLSTALSVLFIVTLQGVAVSAPSAVVAVVTGVLFLAAVARLSALTPDLITDPVTGEAQDPPSGMLRIVTSPWSLVVVMAVLVGLDWFTGSGR